jgi:nucleotide-binding universal stress UspA family protein
MFQRILIATDLSESSSRLMQCVKGLRQLGAREAVLVYSLNLRNVGDLAAAALNLLRPELEKQKQTLEVDGFSVSVELEAGPPETVICEAAEKQDCSLIVVEAGLHSLLGDMLLGSVPMAVIHSARRPVLIVRMLPCSRECDACCNALPCAPLEHILHPTDFSDNAERAFAHVESLVGAGARKVTLMHVQDSVKLGGHLHDRLDEFNRIDTARMERLAERLRSKGCQDVQIELPYGHPVHEILERTRTPGLSLVVMGSQGRGYLQELFLGSVSNNVARQAAVSVLLVPAPR